MVANKKILPRIFFLCGTCALLLLSSRELWQLRSLARSVAQCREAIEAVSKKPQPEPGDLAAKEKRLALLQVATPIAPAAPTTPEGSSADIASLIRERLGQQGIRSENFRTGGSGERESVEFNLRCGAQNFFSFLKGLDDEPHIRIAALSLRPSAAGSTELSVTLRVMAAYPGRAPSLGISKTTVPPELLAMTFRQVAAPHITDLRQGTAFQTEKTAAREIRVPPRPGSESTKEAAPVEAPDSESENRFSLLGYLRDNERDLLFIRDTLSGQILTIGDPERREGEGQLVDVRDGIYSVRMNGRIYKVK
jgi:hypothetical protein